MKSCFFIGHREASDELLPVLKSAIEQHIEEYGVTEFVVGGYGGFDRQATVALIAAKQKHPEITLLRLTPYHPAERQVVLPESFDGIYYPDGMEKVPRRLAIVRANRYAIDRVGYLIAYVRHPGSNACGLVDYATNKGIIVTNIIKQLMEITYTL